MERKEVPDTDRAFLGIHELNSQAMQILHEATCIAHVGPGMPPYLLIHGTKDARVPYEQSPKMCEEDEGRL